MLGTPLLTIFQNAYVFVDSVTITALSFSTLIGFHLKQNDKKKQRLKLEEIYRLVLIYILKENNS